MSYSKQTTLEVPGGAGFVARDKLLLGTRSDGVIIVVISDDFRKDFLLLGGVTEENVTRTKLRIRTLAHSLADEEIVASSDEFVETNLLHIWELLKLQGRGDPGPLLTNGLGNIFYVKNLQGERRAVNIAFSGTGWNLFSRPIPSQHRWHKDDQVIVPALPE